MPTVTLSPSGKRFEAAPGETVLAAALRAGLSLPFGCRNGACGSCAARVLAGTLSYPDGPPRALALPGQPRGVALLCAAVAGDDLHVEIDELDPHGDLRPRTLPCRVVARRELAHDVVGLELALQAGERLRFLAGQYVDVVLRDGARRAFSLANPPRRGDVLELHVRRIPGGRFSGPILDGLRERALLRVEGPLGAFYLRHDDGLPAILVAGGTGFAPIKSIVEDALHAGSGRTLHVYRGARARRDLYLPDLAAGWAAARANVRYVPVLSEPAPGDDWPGRVGLVHEAVLADFPDLAGHAVYLSGPPAMVAAGRAAFVRRGADPRRVRSDAFDFAWETGHDGAG